MSSFYLFRIVADILRSPFPVPRSLSSFLRSASRAPPHLLPLLVHVGPFPKPTPHFSTPRSSPQNPATLTTQTPYHRPCKCLGSRPAFATFSAAPPRPPPPVPGPSRTLPRTTLLPLPPFSLHFVAVAASAPVPSPCTCPGSCAISDIGTCFCPTLDPALSFSLDPFQPALKASPEPNCTCVSVGPPQGPTSLNRQGGLQVDYQPINSPSSPYSSRKYPRVVTAKPMPESSGLAARLTGRASTPSRRPHLFQMAPSEGSPSTADGPSAPSEGSPSVSDGFSRGSATALLTISRRWPLSRSPHLSQMASSEGFPSAADGPSAPSEGPTPLPSAGFPSVTDGPPAPSEGPYPSQMASLEGHACGSSPSLVDDALRAAPRRNSIKVTRALNLL